MYFVKLACVWKSLEGSLGQAMRFIRCCRVSPCCLPGQAGKYVSDLNNRYVSHQKIQK